MSARPDWQELHFGAIKAQVDALEDWLFAAGALSVTLTDQADQPLLEPGPGETPLWDRVQVVALFAGDTDLAPVLAAFPDELATDIPERPQALADREWSRVWEDQFHPLKMGERLWICPSWTSPPEPNATNLMLDPGLAFGTGTHPTTRLCLHALDRLIEEGMTVVDYGCGSGILGIAAALLGAERVLGVDNDPQALIASRNNAESNGIDQTRMALLESGDARLAEWQGAADVVVANILAGPLVALAPLLSALLPPGGRLLLAGLLEDQVATVSAAYEGNVQLQRERDDDGWVLLMGQKC